MRTTVKNSQPCPSSESREDSHDDGCCTVRWPELWAILLFAVAVRSLAIALSWPSLSEDTDAYARLAQNLSRTGTFGFESLAGEVSPTAFRPPLYPWMLSWLVQEDGQLSLIAVAVLHVVLGTATIALTYSIARQLFMRGAWLAAVAVAVDPLLIRASQLVMTETLAAFLAMLVWQLWLVVWRPSEPSSIQNCSIRQKRNRWQWISLISLGLSWGISILARPTAAPWYVLCALSLMFVGCRCWKRRLNDNLIIALGVVVCVVPWSLRNLQTLGTPIWATSHGGYTLLLANNPQLYLHFAKQGPSRDWDATAFHAGWAARHQQNVDLTSNEYWFADHATSAAVTRAGELHDDQQAYAAARATIGRQPAMFALSSVYRVGWFWAWWPNGSGRMSTLVIGTWYGAWSFLCALGIYRLFARNPSKMNTFKNWCPAVLLGVSLTVVHAVYWSNMRMRAPVIPATYLLATAALIQRRLAD